MRGHSACLERLLPVGMGCGFEEAVVEEGALSLVLTDLLWSWRAVLASCCFSSLRSPLTHVICFHNFFLCNSDAWFCRFFFYGESI